MERNTSSPVPDEKAVRIALGNHFKGARVTRGLSREAVAELADLPFKTVGGIERGTSKDPVAWLKYARALQVSLGQLYAAAEVDAQREAG